MSDLPDNPVTRAEKYLANIAGQDVTIPDKPVTRVEKYLAKMAGQDVAVPDPPVTRMEEYLAYIAENGAAGGGDIATQVLNATENGTYRAPAGKAYTPVYVRVPEPEAYDGSYEVTPSEQAQTLPTAGKLLAESVTVNPIPDNYGKITWNGSFLTVS